jgi:hypothetical protein
MLNQQEKILRGTLFQRCLTLLLSFHACRCSLYQFRIVVYPSHGPTYSRAVLLKPTRHLAVIYKNHPPVDSPDDDVMQGVRSVEARLTGHGIADSAVGWRYMSTLQQRHFLPGRSAFHRWVGPLLIGGDNTAGKPPCNPCNSAVDSQENRLSMQGNHLCGS